MYEFNHIPDIYGERSEIYNVCFVLIVFMSIPWRIYMYYYIWLLYVYLYVLLHLASICIFICIITFGFYMYIYIYHQVKKYLQSDWLAHACYYRYSIFLRVKIWSGNTRAAL